MIGSLLWDPDRRTDWRQERLKVDELAYVAAPIRYGRRSKKRERSFTMVFDTKEPLGQAALVPCEFDIETFADLQTEAEELWKAERKAVSRDGIGGSWGCVGALFADEHDQELISRWSAWFRESTSPIAPVDDDGILRIDWPIPSAEGRSVEVDVILATATLAESRRPTIQHIADAWARQGDGYERYFLENVRTGIRTNEDRAIWGRLINGTARWLHRELIQDVNSWLDRTEGAMEGRNIGVSFKPPPDGSFSG